MLCSEPVIMHLHVCMAELGRVSVRFSFTKACARLTFCACFCVCLHVLVYVRCCVYMHVSVYVCACACLCVSACMCVCGGVSVSTCTDNTSLYRNIRWNMISISRY